MANRKVTTAAPVVSVPPAPSPIVGETTPEVRPTPRLNPALLVFAVIPLIALAIALGIGTSHNPAAAANVVPPVIDYSLTQWVGKPAPDFTLKTANGGTVTLSSLHGQLVFLNFWATWCAPCKVEMPSFQKLIDHQIPGKATVLAVDADPLEDAATINAFEKSIGVTIPAAMDSDSSVASTYEVVGKPRTFVIDAQGIIRYDQIGAMPEDMLRAYIAKLAPDAASLPQTAIPMF